MRLALRAGFDTWTGYGNDAIDIAIYAERAGVTVTPIPIGVMAPLPREFTALLERDPRGRQDVAMTFAPPFDVKPWEFADFGRVAVGWTMWERTPIQRADIEGHGWPMNRRTHWWSGGPQPRDLARPRRTDLDALLVTCQMNVEAFMALDPHVRLEVVPCGIDVPKWEFQRRDPTGQLVFGMIGMLNGRKDPFAALMAWKDLKEAHPEFDAKLKVHTLAPGLHPKIAEWLPDVELTSHPMSQAEVADWYRSVDVLISTSRGEGNNKPAMEHMSTGGTVIASDWSGHQNWLHPDCTYALPGQLMEIQELPGTFDFRCDMGVLRDTMLHCWKERTEVVQKGVAASGWIQASLSWEAVIDRMLRVLEPMTR